ncbi:IQ calmodulin-binding motif protein [Aspergillus luchuensis]|uniref:IQ calmodulin-binding motif protein n=1 Tax=Aspergillus kawachii TaxID=1069201 RepID=A0A146FBF4_ASPKA|nr:IQ calmodulin-binding motif protein [Aspergillus luchuensis]
MASAVEPSSNSGSVDPATVAARHVPDHDVTEKRARAAQTIQAVKEAEWRQLHRPSAPAEDVDSAANARRNWLRAVSVAKRAGGDDDEDLESKTARTSSHAMGDNGSGTEGSSPSILHHDLPAGTTAKMMDLQYFLEMVDLKHRHGSNLRVYHIYWKNSPTNQNFFYWLDYGEGSGLDLPQCPREKLERQQVRYLSREERMNYLVEVDEAGKFRWAKNGELIWTDNARFKDSLRGVVPVEEDAPRFRGNTDDGSPVLSEMSDSLESSSGYSSLSEHEDALGKQEKDDYQATKVGQKLAHVSPGTILKTLKGKSSKKEDMWIFVADTTFRLFVGIKESGAFQHSSFLRGARIAAAGLIRIRNGQLRSLAPLSASADINSGHYRPPAANFRAFIHSLQDQGVDMSHVSISKSYAVLAGIEGYTRAKRKVRALQEKVDGAKHKLHQRHEGDESHQRGESTINKNEANDAAEQATSGGNDTHTKRSFDLPFRQKPI